MTALPIPRLNFKSVSTTSPIKKKGGKKIITRRKNLKKRNVEKRRAAAAMGGGGGGGGTTRESRREGGIKRKKERKNKRKETVECVSRSYRVPRQLFWKSGAVTALLNGEFPPPVSTVRFRACAGLPQCNREKGSPCTADKSRESCRFASFGGVQAKDLINGSWYTLRIQCDKDGHRFDSNRCIHTWRINVVAQRWFSWGIIAPLLGDNEPLNWNLIDGGGDGNDRLITTRSCIPL